MNSKSLLVLFLYIVFQFKCNSYCEAPVTASCHVETSGNVEIKVVSVAMNVLPLLLNIKTNNCVFFIESRAGTTSLLHCVGGVKKDF